MAKQNLYIVMVYYKDEDGENKLKIFHTKSQNVLHKQFRQIINKHENDRITVTDIKYLQL